MKKVILFLFTISTVIAAQAQMISSGVSSTVSKGITSSSHSGLDFSGKISTNESESEAVVYPVTTKKSKSLFTNVFGTKSEELASVATQSNKVNRTETTSKSGINRIYFSWNFISESESICNESDYYDEDTRLSFTFGYSHASNLYNKLLYIDYGLALSCTEYYAGDYYGSDSEFNCVGEIDVREVRVSVPVNLMANVRLSKKIYFRPYFGISFSGVIDDSNDYRIYGYDNTSKLESDPFQTNFQYGFGVALGKLYLGYERKLLYEVDIVNLHQNSVTLGVTF